MQWSYWQFWGYSACTFGILIAIPLWLLKLTKDEIDSARRMISQQHNRPEFKKGSMILYGDFMAADRLYFEARMRKFDLKKLEASDESFVGDEHLPRQRTTDRTGPPPTKAPQSSIPSMQSSEATRAAISKAHGRVCGRTTGEAA